MTAGHGVAGHGLPERRPAGIVTRGVAAIIDLGIVLGMLGGAYLGLLLIRLLLSPQSFAFPDPGPLWSIASWLGVSIAYLTGCWATTGRTVGSLAMGVRVTNRKHQRVRWAVSLLRAAACVFFPVGLLWTVIDPNRRSLQDILLRTEVVYDWRQDLDVVTA